MSWTTIWNEEGAILDRRTQSPSMAAATFLLEARRGSDTAARAPIWMGTGNAAMAVSTDADGAFELRHRDTHLRTEPGLFQTGEAFRLVYRSQEDGLASLELRSLDRPGIACFSHTPSGSSPISTDFVPVEPLNKGFGQLAALANHNAPHADGAGLQVGSLVATAAGPRPVEQLSPGDLVVTELGYQALVKSVTREEAVSLGSMNAVRLRAPYFGLNQDVFLCRHTPILLAGPEVEYTFGTDRVAVDAGHLVNGVSVLRDLTEPVREFVTVELDRPGCLSVGRLGIAAVQGAVDCQAIDQVGAQSLLASVADVRDLLG